MKFMKLAFGIAATLYLIGQVQASGILPPQGGKTNVMVEVLIFSGRSNPTWQLQDPKPLVALKANLKDLSEAFKEAPAE